MHLMTMQEMYAATDAELEAYMQFLSEVILSAQHVKDTRF